MAVGSKGRSPEHLYTLRSHPEYLFWTGVGADGGQFLACGLSRVIVSFDRDGHMTGAEERPSLAVNGEAEHWLETAGVTDRPIRVRRFSVPGHRTRIEDLPSHLEDFRREPGHPSFSAAEREAYPGDIAEWLATYHTNAQLFRDEQDRNQN